jgi:hypothetical protein
MELPASVPLCGQGDIATLQFVPLVVTTLATMGTVLVITVQMGITVTVTQAGPETTATMM